ncbi:MAG: hypothetical protein ACRD4D_08620 [Candidatus Acidiferrales bacterium]
MMHNEWRSNQRGGAAQTFLLVLGILILLGLLAVLAGLWAVREFVRVEVDRAGPAKRVSIRTPIGDLEVRKAEDVAEQLKLPIYPGAVPDEDSASVRLRGRLWEEEGGLDVVAAKFVTDHAFESDESWYRQQLGPDFKREIGRLGGAKSRTGTDWKIRIEPGGDDVIFTQEREGRLRGVGLGREAGKVTIGLFQITEASRQ